MDGARFFAERALRYPLISAASLMLAPSTVAGLPPVGAGLITERALGYPRSLEGMLSLCVSFSPACVFVIGSGAPYVLRRASLQWAWVDGVSLLNEH